MANRYCGSTKYTAVAAWAASTTYSVGNIVRQLAAPAVGSERCFRASAITTGISGGTEPAWILTANGVTVDGGVTWTECTGQAIYNGDGGGAAYGAPHARIANAVASTWAAAGDTVYVSNNHAATQASAITITGVGTAAAAVRVVCVNDTVVPPTATATTASESSTGAFGITLSSQYIYIYGVAFNCGSGANVVFLALPSFNAAYFESCTFNIVSTATTSAFGFGNPANTSDALANYLNCKFTFGNVSQTINGNIGCLADITGGSFAATGSVPTALFTPTTGRDFFLKMRGVDLSTITGTIIAASSNFGSAIFTNCKIGAGVVIESSAGTGPGGLTVKAHNCDSAATNYRYFYKNYLATILQETTIVRTGGATDGVTPISWNITTSANSTFYSPFFSEELEQWNDVTGSSKTATVYITSNTALNNNDVWLELEYLSSSTSPISTIVSTKMALLATPVVLTTDASTWGGAVTNKYSLAITFTPSMKGPVKARIYAAKLSTTIYVDPKLSLGVTSNRQYLIPGMGYINETGSTVGSASTAHTFVG